MQLGELERLFVAALRQGDEALGGALRPECAQRAAQRIQIYRHAYGARLGDLLWETYGRTGRVMDDALWREGVERYIRTQPSEHPLLHAWVWGFYDAMVQWYPESPVLDLLHLEQVADRMSVAPELPVFTTQALLEHPLKALQDMRFAFHPAWERCVIHSDAHTHWECARSEIVRTVCAGPAQVCYVWRGVDYAVQLTTTEEAEDRFWEALLGGHTFREAGIIALRDTEDFWDPMAWGERLAQWLVAGIRKGWLRSGSLGALLLE